MNHAHQRYLLAKGSIDDRAYNTDVQNALLCRCPTAPRIVEAGCGTGNTIKRLFDWGIDEFDYFGVDTDPEIISFARHLSLRELRHADFAVTKTETGGQLDRATFAFEQGNAHSRLPQHGAADLFIAQAFADLVEPNTMINTIEAALAPNGLAYLPITFDGGSIFAPEHEVDDLVERAYHRGLERAGQYPRAGRQLIALLGDRSGTLISAGGSDWIIRSIDGTYPADERYFLSCILDFVSMTVNPESVGLDASAFAEWLRIRRTQLDDGKLVYATHQYDLLYQVAST